MSVVAYVVLMLFTGAVGLVVAAALFGMARAVRRRDWAGLRRLGFLVVRLGLIFAGGVLLAVTHGRDARLPMLLLLAFCALQFAVRWRPACAAGLH